MRRLRSLVSPNGTHGTMHGTVHMGALGLTGTVDATYLLYMSAAGMQSTSDQRARRAVGNVARRLRDAYVATRRKGPVAP